MPASRSPATPVLSEAPQLSFAAQIAALREEAGRLIRIRPIPAETGIALLKLLHQVELLAARRYELLLAHPDQIPSDILRETLSRREAMERRHAAQLAQRLQALGGSPPPAGELIAREAGDTLPVVVSSLLAKRDMVKLYRAAIRFLAPRDKGSAALLRLILEEEEAHIAAMRSLVVRR